MKGETTVDFLAKNGCCMREDFVVFDVAPSNELYRYLVFDRNGLYCYKQVANTLASVSSM